MEREPIKWEPLEDMHPVRAFVANWSAFIAAAIALFALVLGVGR